MAGPAMTKSAVYTYTTRTPQLNQPLADKIKEMVFAGQTDGNVRFASAGSPDNVVIRNFVDEASAQEWLAFLANITLLDGQPISTAIVDIVEDPTVYNT